MTDRSLPDRVMVAVRKNGLTLTQEEVWAKVREAVSRGLTSHDEIAGFVLNGSAKPGPKRKSSGDAAATRSSR